MALEWDINVKRETPFAWLQLLALGLMVAMVCVAISRMFLKYDGHTSKWALSDFKVPESRCRNLSHVLLLGSSLILSFWHHKTLSI